jgi:formate hydrogenlyase subunit 3/multisubunit Na+/H+ antiporter MnhD subunit
MGFAVIIEIGRSLLVISHPNGLPIYTAMLVPRILALGILAFALARLRRETGGDLSFRALQGRARTHPVPAFGALIGIFSLAGFPLLAGFPVQLAIWEQLAQVSPATALWTVTGSVGLLAGGMRSLAVLVMGPEEMPPADSTGRMGQFAHGLIIAGVFGVVLLGILL